MIDFSKIVKKYNKIIVENPEGTSEMERQFIKYLQKILRNLKSNLPKKSNAHALTYFSP